MKMPEPVAWTLTEELSKRETTTRAHLWFTNPVNCMWTPLYDKQALVDLLEAAAVECESRQTPNTGSVAILNGAADAIRSMKEKL